MSLRFNAKLFSPQSSKTAIYPDGSIFYSPLLLTIVSMPKSFDISKENSLGLVEVERFSFSAFPLSLHKQNWSGNKTKQNSDRKSFTLR